MNEAGILPLLSGYIVSVVVAVAAPLRIFMTPRHVRDPMSKIDRLMLLERMTENRAYIKRVAAGRDRIASYCESEPCPDRDPHEFSLLSQPADV